MAIYQFDGTMAGLLSCVFRAFQFCEFDTCITTASHHQSNLFDEMIVVQSNDIHAQRVWQGLKKRLTPQGIKKFYYCFLSEQLEAFQRLFNYALIVFQSKYSVESNYLDQNVLAVSQWAKQVGREKHRMEAFVRFKKCKDSLFLSLIHPDFNVLPLIERHFKARYQDQKWLIYDEKRKFGIYYDLKEVYTVDMSDQQIDLNLTTGHSQLFSIELDDEEVLYDQLWKDYFKSVNITARANLKLHIQYVPRRYWRYLNEKQI